MPATWGLARSVAPSPCKTLAARSTLHCVKPNSGRSSTRPAATPTNAATPVRWNKSGSTAQLAGVTPGNEPGRRGEWAT